MVVLSDINRQDKPCSLKQYLTRIFSSDKIIWIIISLLFIINVGYMIYVGPGYTTYSDDMAYVNSGLTLKNLGIISIHEDMYPSAQIMPGMPVLIAVVSMLFGEGTLFWTVLKLVLITFGSMTAYYVYKSVRLFCPVWCAALATLPLFKPDFVCINNQAMTEPPYIFFFTALVYATLCIGQKKYKYCILWIAMFMCALMFRANILPFPVFAAIYFILKKVDAKKILTAGCALLIALACFVVPWSIRNYRYFNTFIPFTYGAGDAIYLGTFQGIGYPEYEAIDYPAVWDEIREDYKYYYTEDNQFRPEYALYVSLEGKERIAKYRINIWMEENPVQCILSYLVIKPVQLMTSIWHNGPWHSVIRWVLGAFALINLGLAILAVYLSFSRKQNRAPVAFLSLFYIGTIYIHSLSFVSGRYALSLETALFIIIGICLPMIKTLVIKCIHKKG